MLRVCHGQLALVQGSRAGTLTIQTSVVLCMLINGAGHATGLTCTGTASPSDLHGIISINSFPSSRKQRNAKHDRTGSCGAQGLAWKWEKGSPLEWMGHAQPWHRISAPSQTNRSRGQQPPACTLEQDIRGTRWQRRQLGPKRQPEAGQRLPKPELEHGEAQMQLLVLIKLLVLTLA